MKKRTGKMISLSLAVAMAMTAAPVTALADEPTASVENTVSVDNAGEQGTEVGTAAETGTETGEGADTTTEKDVLTSNDKEALTATNDLDTTSNEPVEVRVESEEALHEAIKNANDGDKILVTTGFTLTKPVIINKGITVEVDHGIVLTVDPNGDFNEMGDNHVFRLSHKDAVLDNVTLYLQDNHQQLNIVYVSAGTVKDCWLVGSGATDNPVTRGIMVESGAKNVTITGNHFEDFFASAYINSGAEGTITNNESKDTKEGWCIVNSSDMEFSNNTFSGTNGVEMKLFDENPVGTSNYDVIEMSNDNPGVSIQDEVKMITAQDGCLVVDANNAFATLDKALEAAEDGDTIKLKTDITVTSTGSVANQDPAINITKAITLDGDGHTIYGSNFTTNNGKAINSILDVKNQTGVVTIQNVKIIGDETSKHCLNLYDANDVVIDGVTVEAKSSNGYGMVVNSSNVTVENMTASGSGWFGGAVNVDASESNGSNVIIKDGNFSGSTSLKVERKNGQSDVTIEGGNFEGYVGTWGAATEDDLSITGGTFKTDINKYLPAGIAAEYDEATKTWVVKVDPTIHDNSIRIGYKWYTSEDELKQLIADGIPEGATVEVYGKVNIPHQTFVPTSNTELGRAHDGYFVIPSDNVTIKGMTEDATLYSSTPSPTQNWGGQSFVLILGNNVTLEGLTIMPHLLAATQRTNKAVEVAGENFTMRNCTITPNENTIDGGSLYFNGNKGTVVVEGCTFNKSLICFDSVETATSIEIKNNIFNQPKNDTSYMIGNVTWAGKDKMANVTVEGNDFKGLPADYDTLVLQRMEGNFILKDNTTDNGKSIADMVKFDKVSGAPEPTLENMHVIITENGQTTVLTPAADGEEPESKTFALDKTSVSIKVGRTVTLTASMTGEKTLTNVTWTVNGDKQDETSDTFAFTPNTKGTHIVTATYVQDAVTYTATCEVTAKSSSSSSRYDGYITIINPKNGEVSVSDDWANEDDKITLTITPDKGYVVDKIEIVDAEGDKIDAKKIEDKDNKYTFRMANCDVTVTVTFKEEGKTTDDKDENKEDGKDDETTETTKLNFTDVNESDWFYKGIAYVVDKGIMSGVSENQFDPSGKLTRAMLVQMLYNMESRPACSAENVFIDVPVGQWYTDAVVWANDAKIVSGMGEGLFAPNMEITREQMVAMLYNYAKYKGYDVTASADLSTFADSANVSAWAQPAMQWAVAEGYISGMGGSLLAPQGTATRAEIASVIMRFMEATAESAESAE